MITVRAAADRGHFDFGWLDTRHTFSFGEYLDPRHMGFGSLRVLNEDRVKPGQGFGAHGHRDMEILSYVLSGELSHKDSEGNSGVINPGDVQRMSAGTGIRHSEFNASPTEPVHFLQIWILPDRRGVTPRYEDRAFPADRKRNRLCLIASPDGAEGSLSIHQDVRVHATLLDTGREVSLDLAEGRRAWVQVARGRVSLEPAGEGRTVLAAGDGGSLEGIRRFNLRAESAAEALLFDLG